MIVKCETSKIAINKIRKGRRREQQEKKQAITVAKNIIAKGGKHPFIMSEKTVDFAFDVVDICIEKGREDY
jgi:hypothetical protein